MFFCSLAKHDKQKGCNPMVLLAIGLDIQWHGDDVHDSYLNACGSSSKKKHLAVFKAWVCPLLCVFASLTCNLRPEII